MYGVLLLCGSLLATVGAAAVSENWLDGPAYQFFEDFIRQYEKKYESDQEKQYRFKIFKDNLEHVKKLNADVGKEVYGITLFSDQESSEFRRLYTGFSRSSTETSCKTLTDDDIPDANAPDSFDWRDRNAVTPVKNQDQCGSCYAFSCTGQLEGQYAIKHNQLLNLSEQEILDCDKTDLGCSGGDPIQVMSWIKDNNGLETEDDYPYTAFRNECLFNASKAAVQVTDCYTYHLTSQDKVKQLLYKNGPLSINVKSLELEYYNKDTITQCDGPVDHSVLLVGYKTDPSGSYWIVKNSWGEWGIDGYFHLGIGDGDKSCGMMDPGNINAAVIA